MRMRRPSLMRIAVYMFGVTFPLIGVTMFVNATNSITIKAYVPGPAQETVDDNADTVEEDNTSSTPASAPGIVASPGIASANKIEAPTTHTNNETEAIESYHLVNICTTEDNQAPLDHRISFRLSRILYEFARTQYQVSVKNLSDFTIIPVGYLVISNSRGRIIDRVTVNPNGEKVAPGKDAVFYPKWNPPILKTFGKFTINLEGDCRQFVADAEQLPLARTVWIFPIKTITAIISFMTIRRILRHYDEAKRRRMNRLKNQRYRHS